MFVEADHSVVFRRRAAMYLLPVEQKDGVCRSFEDEAELRMLCKDWQIAKRKTKADKRSAGSAQSMAASALCCALKLGRSRPILLRHWFCE